MVYTKPDLQILKLAPGGLEGGGLLVPYSNISILKSANETWESKRKENIANRFKIKGLSCFDCLQGSCLEVRYKTFFDYVLLEKG